LNGVEHGNHPEDGHPQPRKFSSTCDDQRTKPTKLGKYAGRI
jgi:hypothetical protein